MCHLTVGNKTGCGTSPNDTTNQWLCNLQGRVTEVIKKGIYSSNRKLHDMSGLPYIPCHLGLKRLDPSGWQMIDPTATICLSNENDKIQHKHPSMKQTVQTPTIRISMEVSCKNTLF